MTRDELLRVGVRLAIAGSALTAAAVFFGQVFVGSRGNGLVQPIDMAARTWTQLNVLPLLPVADLLAITGATALVLVVSALVSVLLWWWRRDPALALLPLLSVMTADVVGALTKVLVARPRPTLAEIGLLEHYSFPSEHTVAATSLAAALLRD